MNLKKNSLRNCWIVEKKLKTSIWIDHKSLWIFGSPTAIIRFENWNLINWIIVHSDRSHVSFSLLSHPFLFLPLSFSSSSFFFPSLSIHTTHPLLALARIPPVGHQGLQDLHTLLHHFQWKVRHFMQQELYVIYQQDQHVASDLQR